MCKQLTWIIPVTASRTNSLL
nr:unnamed protein product [Callosobruchus analis]